jgi:hypothetical protein
MAAIVKYTFGTAENIFNETSEDLSVLLEVEDINSVIGKLKLEPNLILYFLVISCDLRI